MRSIATHLPIWLLTAAVSVPSWTLAAGESVVDSIPPPYPSTGAPEPTLHLAIEPTGYPSTGSPETLPLESGVPTPASRSESAAPFDQPVDGTSVDVEVVVEPEPRWYQPSYWLRPPGWDTAIELGINGSSGTSESFSMRTGGYVKRETEHRKLDFNIYYNRTQAGGVETQNNSLATFRHDWLFPESPWTVYILTQLFYDEFQAFDLNTNVNGGIGYRLLDNDWVELIGRLGSGASREFGGVDNRWVPEAQFGLDYEQKISETQKFTTTVDYFPEWDDFAHHRLLTDIGYEVELLVPSNVSLKIAATNRYDSDPNGADPNNLNYSVLLLWKL